MALIDALPATKRSRQRAVDESPLAVKDLIRMSLCGPSSVVCSTPDLSLDRSKHSKYDG